MTTWRIFAVRKLQGDTNFDIKTKEKNWKTFPQFDEFEWETLQMELSLSQEELISELEKRTSDEFLDQIVPGRTYSFYTMLHGVSTSRFVPRRTDRLTKKSIKFGSI